jgi:hypothetical protein
LAKCTGVESPIVSHRKKLKGNQQREGEGKKGDGNKPRDFTTSGKAKRVK